VAPVIRHCDGTDSNLIGEDGHSPCRCGARFDDVHRLVIWPHQRIPSPAEKRHLLDALFAAHAGCPDTCEIGRIGRLTRDGDPAITTARAFGEIAAGQAVFRAGPNEVANRDTAERRIVQGTDPLTPVQRCRHGNPPGCIRCAIIITGV